MANKVVENRKVRLIEIVYHKNFIGKVYDLYVQTIKKKMYQRSMVSGPERALRDGKGSPDNILNRFMIAEEYADEFLAEFNKLKK